MSYKEIKIVGISFTLYIFKVRKERKELCDRILISVYYLFNLPLKQKPFWSLKQLWLKQKHSVKEGVKTWNLNNDWVELGVNVGEAHFWGYWINIIDMFLQDWQDKRLVKAFFEEKNIKKSWKPRISVTFDLVEGFRG